MSTQVAAINLGGAAVGTAGSIPLGQVTPPPTLSQQMRPNDYTGSTLFIWNESGAGLTCLWPNSRETFTLPAGQWRPLKIPPDEEQLHYLVTYVIPNAPVSLLLADLYLPGEQIDPLGILGNSPVAGTVATTPVPLYFNVKDPAFGATGNGTIDDTSAISSAILAASVAGGVVFFPPGTYLVTSPLTISADNVQLLGCGRSSNIHFGVGTGPTPVNASMIQFVAFVGVAHLGVRVSNLLITSGLGSGITALELDQTYYAVIDNVDIEGVYATSIFLNGAGGLFGAYTHISNCHIGATPGGAGSAGIGILTNNHEFITVEDCVINWFNQAGGIGAKIANANCSITDNSFDQCQTSLSLFFCPRASVKGNQFDRGQVKFVYATGATECVIAGNLFGVFNGVGNQSALHVDNVAKNNTIEANIWQAGTTWNRAIDDGPNTAAQINYYLNNNVNGLAVNRTFGVFRGNAGVNPVTNPGTPAVPASGTPLTNATTVDCSVIITALNTLTAVAINGVAVGIAPAAGSTYWLPALSTITLTYAGAAPTWQWLGD